MKKLFRKLHLWLSVPFGLILSLICFSGAALVFETEITELCHPQLYYVKKVEATPLPIDVLLPKVAATLPDSFSITGVSITPDLRRAYQVNITPGKKASVYVDQYTGEVLGKSKRLPFFSFMFRLHRWLLDSVQPGGGVFWGKMIVGVSTLMFVFVLLSGVVAWWPRTKKVLKNSFRVNVRKGWRRFWYDLHIAGGLYAMLLLLAMALTGLTWSFPWYRAGFYKVFGLEMPQGGGAHGASAQATQKKEGSHRHGAHEDGRQGGRRHNTPFAHWQRVYDDLKASNPEYRQITLSKGTANVSFRVYGNQRAADRYAFNPRNGEITDVTLYKDAEASGKMRGWIYSVHVGNWGGLFTRILTFLAALAGGMLPLTGYYLWLRRLKWNF